ncbi:MAG TPA: TIGR03557 family F420-dependent LLM class oxidoreductase [Acidimicrobiales bacterium]|jgi:G6PDH family F420-dependent oxidoreductase|nr:TIGR03557 family F420-dependent LLM class oxidoreductase [Acidimicrobiales bacterium]
MAEIGAFLSSEEHGPRSLLAQAQMAEAAEMRGAFISDHFHPWIDSQGHSPFVWSVVGAIGATTSLHVTTGVTCPTVRVHPAILSQAAATTQCLLDGRFVFGVGSGEALNEHILGDHWPPVATRLEMLEEAVEVIRKLWQGGLVTHHGRHYTVENARLYTLPDSPPPIAVSAFGPEAAEVAARIGDGFVTTKPGSDLLEQYRRHGGRGDAIAALKVCWDPDEGRARKLAHQLWPTEAVEGQLSQELALPSHFEAAASHVTEDMVADLVPCGPDPERHVAAIERFLEAGFDRVYVNQIGPDQEGFFAFYRRELRPRLVT